MIFMGYSSLCDRLLSLSYENFRLGERTLAGEYQQSYTISCGDASATTQNVAEKCDEMQALFLCILPKSVFIVKRTISGVERLL